MSTKQAVAEAIYMLLKGADLSLPDAHAAVNMGLSDYSLSLGHGPTYNPEHEAMSNDPSFCPDVKEDDTCFNCGQPLAVCECHRSDLDLLQGGSHA